MANMQNELTVKRSVPVLIVKLLVAELMILSLYSFSKIVLFWLSSNSDFTLITNPILFLKSSLFGIIEIIAVIFILVEWVNNYYILRKKEIVYVNGIFKISRRTYNLTNVQSVYYEQSLLGRLLKFGTVKIFSPALQKDLYLTEVPYPENVVENIKLVANSEDANVRFILRR
jgi:uncharacterized membrane protein YdbT with pleckstrin-like domain